MEIFKHGSYTAQLDHVSHLESSAPLFSFMAPAPVMNSFLFAELISALLAECTFQVSPHKRCPVLRFHGCGCYATWLGVPVTKSGDTAVIMVLTSSFPDSLSVDAKSASPTNSIDSEQTFTSGSLHWQQPRRTLCQRAFAVPTHNGATGQATLK